MEGIWPLVVLWVLALLLGGGRKKRPPARETEATDGGDALREELERLRQVETAARRKIEARQRQAGQAASRRPQPERKVYHPKPRRAQHTEPPQVEVPIEDLTVTSLEGRDYDEEAERVVLARRRVAEDRSGSAEELTEVQRSRRAVLVEAAPDDEQRHAAFHGRLAAVAAPSAAAVGPTRRSPLGRFADGTARSAIILSAIIGRPIGDR